MLYIFGQDEKLLTILPQSSFFEPIHREVLNGENIFTFATPADNVDTFFIEEGNYVGFKDLDGYWQMFEIKKITDLHGDVLNRHVYCEHIFYELLNDIVVDRRPSGNATAALDGMLEGTRWQLGVVDDLGAANTNVYYEPALLGIQKVATAWGGELQWRIIVSNNSIEQRIVDLLAVRGHDTGKQFAYAKDILEVEREVDISNLATALYGRGKGVEIETDVYGRRLNFADVVAGDKPFGQEWVGDDEALARWGRGGRHRFDVFIDEEETDATKLLEKTRNELTRRKQPNVTYRLDVVNLEQLTGYTYEKVRLGDLVRVIDKEFKPELIVSARVVELDRDLLAPENTKIVLGNFSPNIVSITGNLNKRINEMANKPYNTKWLDGVINVLQNAIENTEAYIWETPHGTLHLNAPSYEEATEAMLLGGGRFAIANQKDGQGGWNWRTFGDGSGFTADLLNAGKVKADLVTIGPETTFAPGYDPSQIEGAHDPLRLDARCKALFHFDGSINDHRGITPTFTRNSIAYTSDGRKVEPGVPRFEQGKFGQAVMVEEGTTNLIANPLVFTGWFSSMTAVSNDGTFYPPDAKFARVTTTDWGARSNYVAASNGQTWSVSFIARKGTGDGEPRAGIMIFNSSATHIDNISLSFASRDIGNEWVKYKAIFTINNVNTGYIQLRLYVTATNGGYHDFALPQLEQKPYATSFIEGTRQPETLTIPTAGVLNPQEGAVALYLYVNPAHREPSKTRRFFGHFPGPGSANRISMQHNNDNFWLFTIGDANGNTHSLNIADNEVADGWRQFVMKWGAEEFAVYVDGIKKANLLNPTYLPSSVGDIITVSEYTNALLDELAIFNYAPTDEEIQSWYDAQAPFYALDLPNPNLPGYVKVESEGMKVYDSQANLRVLLGSWLKGAVRKYGLKVNEGEIYGTKIRSGNEGDTSYVGLDPGLSPLQVVVNNKTALNMFVSDDNFGGSIQFYNVAANDMRGQITPFSDAQGDGLRIHSRTSSGLDKDLVMWASSVVLDTGFVQVRKWVGEDSILDVNGTIWAKSLILSGGKSAVVVTDNYGPRLLYSVESPESLFYDSGSDFLEHGEKTITLDPIFLECVEPNSIETPWQVWVQSYGENGVYVTETGEDYFKVKERNGGASNDQFVWRLEATRKGFAGTRLVELDYDHELLTSGWEDEILNELEETTVDEDVLTSEWEDKILEGLGDD